MMINRLFFSQIFYHWKTTVPPRWILEPTDKAFAQGSNAKVECKSDGFPKPQITWKKAVGKCEKESLTKRNKQRIFY